MLFPLFKRKLVRKKKRHVGKALTAGTTLPMAGRAFVLKLSHEPQIPEGCALVADALVVNLHAELTGAPRYHEARTLLRLWLKKEARQVFPECVTHWAAKMGVKTGGVIVTDTRGRWGSCNYRNDIRLNWRLLLVPPDLMDYVVAHELAHIVHKNHSATYWAFLGQTMPDYATRRAKLRAFEKTWSVSDLL